ncbi:MAG: AAA family ATPase [Odoribacteraceae bacterium]|jgi:exodeoxyribonuclease-5|nr:AAA family ATPase [Odoribacteraceae bacterium]
MTHEHFKQALAEKFALSYSPSQREAVDRFIAFLQEREENLFLLKGYAGTGKTSLVAAIVNTLVAFGFQVVLLAPTGRAAKVFSAYAGLPAYTIHKKIYRQRDARDGIGLFQLGFNGGANALFFVDEASMIGAELSDSTFGSGSLLDDLFRYVYNGRGNRLVLIGDDAQLPPVGTRLSPALDADFLQRHHAVRVHEAALTHVMRQAEASGILYNATRVRQMIGRAGLPRLQAARFQDIRRVTGAELIEELEQSYSRVGEDETVVICRSNRQAQRFNAGIRGRILYREEALSTGDRVMIVKNNYFWLSPGQDGEKTADKTPTDFIANGDMATILRVGRHADRYGFHFARVRLRLHGREEETEAWVMLDTLATEYPSLTRDEYARLYAAIEEDHVDEPSRQKRYKKILENEFFNALQLKFAYAITGHKAQGGQWHTVLLDPGQGRADTPDDEYWRWLYTAFTRARASLLLVNFADAWFENKKVEK